MRRLNIQFIPMFSYYLLWRDEELQGLYLKKKKSRNFKKFKILESKTRNTMSRNGQDKKNEIFYLENQDKKCSLRNLVLMKYYSVIYYLLSRFLNPLILLYLCFFCLRFLMDPETNYRLEQHLLRTVDKERLHRGETVFSDNGLSATN